MSRGTLVCIHQFNTPHFLVEDKWKTVGVFEAILRDTSRLTAVFQDDEKLNGACGPVMQKSLHDRLSRVTMRMINSDQWSSNKDMMHPTRSDVNVNSFSKAKNPCKRRALLQCERIFFNNKSEITFAEANSVF